MQHVPEQPYMSALLSNLSSHPTLLLPPTPVTPQAGRLRAHPADVGAPAAAPPV